MMTPDLHRVKNITNEITPGLKLLNGAPLTTGSVLKGERELKRTPPDYLNSSSPDFKFKRKAFKPRKICDPEHLENGENVEQENEDTGELWFVNLKTPGLSEPKDKSEPLDFGTVVDGKIPSGRALPRSPVRLSNASDDGLPTTPNSEEIGFRDVVIEPGSRIPRTPICYSGRPSAACDLVIHYSKNKQKEDRNTPKTDKSRKRSLSSNSVPVHLEEDPSVVSKKGVFLSKSKLSRTPLKRLSLAPNEKSILKSLEEESVSMATCVVTHLVNTSNDDIKEDDRYSPERSGQIFKPSNKLVRSPVTDLKGAKVTVTVIPGEVECYVSNVIKGSESHISPDRSDLKSDQVNYSSPRPENQATVASPVLQPLSPAIKIRKPAKNMIPRGKTLIRTPPSGKYSREEGEGNSFAPALTTVEEDMADDPDAIFMSQLRNADPLPNKRKKKTFLKSNKSKIVLTNKLKKTISSIPTVACDKNSVISDNKPKDVEKVKRNKERKLTYVMSKTHYLESKLLFPKRQGSTFEKSADGYIHDNENDNCKVPTHNSNTNSTPDDSNDNNSLLCLDYLCDQSFNLCDSLFTEASERKKSIINIEVKESPAFDSVLCTNLSDNQPDIPIKNILLDETPSKIIPKTKSVINETFKMENNSDTDEEFVDAVEDIEFEGIERMYGCDVRVTPPLVPANSTFDVESKHDGTFDIEITPSKDDEHDTCNKTFQIHADRQLLNDTFDMNVEEADSQAVLNSTYDNNKPDNIESPNNTLENTASTVIENITPNKTFSDHSKTESSLTISNKSISCEGNADESLKSQQVDNNPEEMQNVDSHEKNQFPSENQMNVSSPSQSPKFVKSSNEEHTPVDVPIKHTNRKMKTNVIESEKPENIDEASDKVNLSKTRRERKGKVVEQPDKAEIRSDKSGPPTEESPQPSVTGRRQLPRRNQKKIDYSESPVVCKKTNEKDNNTDMATDNSNHNTTNTQQSEVKQNTCDKAKTMKSHTTIEEVTCITVSCRKPTPRYKLLSNRASFGLVKESNSKHIAKEKEEDKLKCSPTEALTDLTEKIKDISITLSPPKKKPEPKKMMRNGRVRTKQEEPDPKDQKKNAVVDNHVARTRRALPRSKKFVGSYEDTTEDKKAHDASRSKPVISKSTELPIEPTKQGDQNHTEIVAKLTKDAELNQTDNGSEQSDSTLKVPNSATSENAKKPIRKGPKIPCYVSPEVETKTTQKSLQNIDHSQDATLKSPLLCSAELPIEITNQNAQICTGKAAAWTKDSEIQQNDHVSVQSKSNINKEIKIKKATRKGRQIPLYVSSNVEIQKVEKCLSEEPSQNLGMVYIQDQTDSTTFKDIDDTNAATVIQMLENDAISDTRVGNKPKEVAEVTNTVTDQAEKKIKRRSGIPMGLGLRHPPKPLTTKVPEIKEKVSTNKMPESFSVTAKSSRLNVMRKSYGIPSNSSTYSNGIEQKSTDSYGFSQSKAIPEYCTVVSKPQLRRAVSHSTIETIDTNLRRTKKGKMDGKPLSQAARLSTSSLKIFNNTDSKLHGKVKKIVDKHEITTNNIRVSNIRLDVINPRVANTKTIVEEMPVKKSVVSKTRKTRASKIVDSESKTQPAALSDIPIVQVQDNKVTARLKRIPSRKGLKIPNNGSPVSPTVIPDSITKETEKNGNPKPRKRQKRFEKAVIVASQNNTVTIDDLNIDGLKLSDPVINSDVLKLCEEETMNIDNAGIVNQTVSDENMVNNVTDQTNYRNIDSLDEDAPPKKTTTTTKKPRRKSFLPVCRGTAVNTKAEDQSTKSKGLEETVKKIEELTVNSPVKATHKTTEKKFNKDNSESSPYDKSPDKEQTLPKKRGHKKIFQGTTNIETEDVVESEEDNQFVSQPKSSAKTTTLHEQIQIIEIELKTLNSSDDVTVKSVLKIKKIKIKLAKLNEKLEVSSKRQVGTRSLRSTRLKE